MDKTLLMHMNKLTDAEMSATAYRKRDIIASLEGVADKLAADEKAVILEACVLILKLTADVDRLTLLYNQRV